MFTSFDPYKVLFYIDDLKKLAKGIITNPVKVSIDLTNVCNHSCFFCNSAYSNCKSNYSQLSYNHVVNIIDCISLNWNNSLKSICFAGGGEPFAHPEASNIFTYVSETYPSLEFSVITNGSLLTSEDCVVLSNTARYVGVSIESATAKTHNKIRRTNDFDHIISNLKELSKLLHSGRMTDICVKVLVNHYNYHELYDLAKICLDCGVSTMHIRPVGIDNVLDRYGNVIGTNYNLKDFSSIISEQYKNIRTLKTDTFNPVIVSHMFNDNMGRIVPFKKCYLTPLSTLCFSADGNCYICVDHRGHDNFNLGSHFPDVNNIISLWGSDYHKSLIDNINPNLCMRCTQLFGNSFIEEAIHKDNMYRNFI